MKKKIKSPLFTAIIVATGFLFLVPSVSWAAITSVVLTPGNPTTLSDGRGYYLAGKTYNFTVQVIDPDAADWTNISEVRMRIANSTLLEFHINPDGSGGSMAAAAFDSGTANVSWVYAGGSTCNNFTITFSVQFQWNTEESGWAVGRSIVASASNPVPPVVSVTQNVSYGVVSSIRLLNFTLGGEAADGKVNPHHAAFNITGGEIVYNIPGAVASDAVRSHADAGNGEITGTDLYVGTHDMGNDDDDDGIQNFALTDSAFDGTVANSATEYTVLVRATMATIGVTVDTSNTLSIFCNEVRVTDITFFNGGGIDIDPDNYYRSLLVTGTQVRVDAEMLAGASSMEGDVTVELRDSTDGTITSVVIPNGQTYGIATVTTAGLNVPADSTVPRSYEVYNVYGGVYNSVAGAGLYRNSSAVISQPATHRIHWENGDAPGSEANPFNGTSGAIPNGVIYNGTSTDDSVRIEWVPLTITEPSKDRDFYSYRIYYRETGTTEWTMIDRNTSTSDNRYNPGGVNDLSNASTAFADIINLKPLTIYEYRFSAVDVFGNEVADTYRPTSDGVTIAHAQTAALSVVIKLSDGITEYQDADFADNDGSTKQVRRSAITITATISGDTLPETVNLIAAADGLNQTTEVNNNIRDASVTTYVIAARKITANDWEVIIPTTSPLMNVNTGVRFILEINTNKGTSYVDHNSESDVVGAGTPWDDLEWRFQVRATQPTFTPWPTRILNNVITRANPVAYPAYYLSEDAYVTIKVYDIKGRPVATILEGALRKGGQNIKDQGWRGTNKARRELGVGLYYIHIKAKATSSGKTVLNHVSKVVIKR